MPAIPASGWIVIDDPEEGILIGDEARDVVIARMEIYSRNDPEDHDAAQLERATLMAAAQALRRAAEFALASIELEADRFEDMKVYQKLGRTNWPMIRDELRAALVASYVPKSEGSPTPDADAT